MGHRFFETNESMVKSSFGFTSDIGAKEDQLSVAPLRTMIESILAIVILVSILPLLLFVGVLVKLTSQGPIFFIQKRVGLHGSHFNILKFRTMATDAEQKTGPVLSFKGDPRVTRLGRILRNSHVDELPQLINIIRGDMSFIGPRPERPEFVSTFNQEIFRYRHRERVKPGVTGLAQVCCQYDAGPEEKLEFDLGYLKHHNSIRMNLTIVMFTLKKVLSVRFH